MQKLAPEGTDTTEALIAALEDAHHRRRLAVYRRASCQREFNERRRALGLLEPRIEAVISRRLELFEQAGYQVHLACDGVEALALLEKGRYGLMVTDLEMPNMDGVTLINTCLDRPQTARMPILAVSGHESLRAKFNECRNIAGVHRKPWVDDILLSHVATLVRTHQARVAETA